MKPTSPEQLNVFLLDNWNLIINAPSLLQNQIMGYNRKLPQINKIFLGICYCYLVVLAPDY